MIKLKEIMGYDNLPPYQHWSNSNEELEVAVKSPFTAWDYALRTGRPNPRLWAVIRGSPYEKEYIRKFGPQI